MFTCAVCGKNMTRYGVCNTCWKEWTFTGTYIVQNIGWLSELVRIQRRFERGKAGREVAFSDTNIDTETWY